MHGHGGLYVSMFPPLFACLLGQAKRNLLVPETTAPFGEVEHRFLTGTEPRRQPVRRAQGRQLHAGRDFGWVDSQPRHGIRIHLDAGQTRIVITGHPWKLDFEARLLRHGIHMARLRIRIRSFPALGDLERNQFERHAEHLGGLLREQAILTEGVMPTPQGTAYHLFAQQLGSERAQTDDVGHGIGVPAFGQHGHGDDTTHFPPGRDGLRQRMQPAAVVRMDLLVVPARQFDPILGRASAKPSLLTNGIEYEAQPLLLVGAGTGLDVLPDPGIDAYGSLPPRLIAKALRRLPAVAFMPAQGQPLIHSFGERGVPADHDEHRRRRVRFVIFPRTFVPGVEAPFP